MSTLLVILNSLATCAAAGAIIDEETGLTSVKAETMMVVAHFWRYDQLEYNSELFVNCKVLAMAHFLGFMGSLGPSQSTHNMSASDASF